MYCMYQYVSLRLGWNEMNFCKFVKQKTKCCWSSSICSGHISHFVWFEMYNSPQYLLLQQYITRIQMMFAENVNEHKKRKIFFILFLKLYSWSLRNMQMEYWLETKMCIWGRSIRIAKCYHTHYNTESQRFIQIIIWFVYLMHGKCIFIWVHCTKLQFVLMMVIHIWIHQELGKVYKIWKHNDLLTVFLMYTFAVT